MNQLDSFPQHAAIPSVSTDGLYLFFTSRGDIYWVSTKIIDDLKKLATNSRIP
jgi:hypothetical protein